ncbi:MFS transporter [Alloscardovia theropitheci]|uniref:MFS transporter n=1 Tax=Alloscardovia theropitheci TaxID=2496842 RepID=A0A4R0QQ60_9BIFI|nr:MFS transporter [Alloscardovia theropitheci]TCD54432.1 MFS transporter [Alloscardovia theropitheci]
MYRQIFKIPGTLAFSISGAMTRATMSTIGLSMILCLNNLYNEWTSAGLLSAVYVISAAVVTPFYARLFDKYGQKRIGLMIAPVQFALLLAFAAAAYFRAPLALLFTLAILIGFCMYSVGAAVRTRWAWALSDKPEDYLNTAYSWEAAIDEIIFIFGPILAATISTSFPPISTIIPFILFGGINFIGAMIFYNLKSANPPAVVAVQEVDIDDNSVQTDVPDTAMSEQMKKLYSRHILLFPGMLFLIFAITFFNSTFSAYDVTMTAVMKEIGLYQRTGFMLATIAVGSLMGALFFGSRKHKHNSWIRMMIFMAFLSLGIAGVSISMTMHQIILAGLFGVFAGLFVAPTYATANLIMRQTAPANQLTEGLSWISTGSTVGSSIGSAVGGIFLDQVGNYATLHLLWINALIALPLFFLGYMQVRSFEKKHGIKFEIVEKPDDSSETDK